MKEFSVQQYTFRPLSNEIGLFPVLKKLSAMGYTGLESCFFRGFDEFDIPAREFHARLDDLGLKLIGNHFTHESFTGSYRKAFEYIAQAGGRYALFNIWQDYNKLEDIETAAKTLNEISKIAQDCGITIAYHNHASEFETLEGRLIIDWLLEQFDENICLETDVYFAREHIEDVCGYIRNHAARIRLVHLKQRGLDGSCVDLPDGIIDMSAVRDSAACATDFILEQHGNFPVSILHSLERNAEFLKTL